MGLFKVLNSLHTLYCASLDINSNTSIQCLMAGKVSLKALLEIYYTEVDVC
jgi:hypothetical protein